MTTPKLQSRRSFLSATGIILAAPAIIRTPGLLMPVSRMRLSVGTVISGAGLAEGTTITALALGLAFSEVVGGVGGRLHVPQCRRPGPG